MSIDQKIIFVEETTAFLDTDPLADVVLEGMRQVTRLRDRPAEVIKYLKGLNPREVAGIVLPSFDTHYDDYVASFNCARVVHAARNAGYSRGQLAVYTGTPSPVFQRFEAQTGVQVLHRTDPGNFFLLRAWLAIRQFMGPDGAVYVLNPK